MCIRDRFKAGDVVEGTVDSLKNYGAFIKLADGVDGLLHVSQISTQRIKHPGVVPVSYTHLDVYKRQFLIRTMRRFS